MIITDVMKGGDGKLLDGSDRILSRSTGLILTADVTYKEGTVYPEYIEPTQSPYKAEPAYKAETAYRNPPINLPINQSLPISLMIFYTSYQPYTKHSSSNT